MNHERIFFTVEEKDLENNYWNVISWEKQLKNCLSLIADLPKDGIYEIDIHFCLVDDNNESIFEDGQSEYLIATIFPKTEVMFRRKLYSDGIK